MAQVDAVLAVQHGVIDSPVIERMAAFAQPEDGGREIEVDVGAVGSETDLLADFAVLKSGDGERMIANLQRVPAPGNGLLGNDAGLDQRRGPRAVGDAELVEPGTVVGGRDADAKRAFGDSSERHFKQARRSHVAGRLPEDGGCGKAPGEQQLRGSGSHAGKDGSPRRKYGFVQIHSDLRSMGAVGDELSVRNGEHGRAERGQLS